MGKSQYLTGGGEGFLHCWRLSVTRDRIYATGKWLGREFRVIDTSGIMIDEPLMDQINYQADIAMKADVILFSWLACKKGLADADEAIAHRLHQLINQFSGC